MRLQLVSVFIMCIGRRGDNQISKGKEGTQTKRFGGLKSVSEITKKREKMDFMRKRKQVKGGQKGRGKGAAGQKGRGKGTVGQKGRGKGTAGGAKGQQRRKH